MEILSIVLSVALSLQMMIAGFGSMVGQILPTAEPYAGSLHPRTASEPVYMIWGIDKNTTGEELGYIIREETGVEPQQEGNSWKILNKKGFTYYDMPAALYATCFEDEISTYLYSLSITLDVSGKGNSWAAWSQAFDGEAARAEAAMDIVLAFDQVYQRLCQDVGDSTSSKLSARIRGERLFSELSSPFAEETIDLDALAAQLASGENENVQFRIRFDNVELLLYVEVREESKTYYKTSIQITYHNKATTFYE